MSGYRKIINDLLMIDDAEVDEFFQYWDNAKCFLALIPQQFAYEHNLFNLI